MGSIDPSLLRCVVLIGVTRNFLLSSGTFFEGVKEEVVLSPAHALSLIAAGEEHGHVGSTNFNLFSIRSHTIFTLTIESSSCGENSEGEAVNLSQLNLIDLASSESSKAETTGIRRKEGSYINKILLTLGTIFYAKRDYVKRLVYASDETCIEKVGMNRITFFKLCEMLQTLGGLKSSRNMLVDVQVAIFLHIISHHLKNRVIKHHYRSGETVSRSFHYVLNAVIRLQDVLFKKAEPITANSTDPRWKWFKVLE
ncbi:hypothetical protein PVK06_023845 [Gossypium arboreum]|uniref:Kinesin motor domain-containing protein n=1 Tax=Gossypium arboreum TaxID=29729 RepID=A0ABR0PCB0_GOSAR|nr:hypothetical protein PVK06_023845 [Gossypium arboreum]